MNFFKHYFFCKWRIFFTKEKEYSFDNCILNYNAAKTFSCLILLVIFWIILGPFPRSLAAVGGLDAFTVTNIRVDVTANTAAEAREQALELGEKKAFEKLLKRLTRRIDHKHLFEFDQEQIPEYIQDFGIENEKNSEVRYIADLTYRFKPHYIRTLLRNNNIQFAETISKPVLILPVYQVAGAVSLWDDPNPWRDAFTNLLSDKQPKTSGLVPMLIGKGDLLDISMISGELAVKGDRQRLKDITRRYSLKTSAVVLAILRSTDQGLLLLDITVTRYAEKNKKTLFATQIKAKKAEGVRNLLARAANQIIWHIEDYWKSENLLKFESEGVIAAVLPIKNLKEWVDAKKRFAKVAVINRIDLILFSRSEVLLNIHFIGENKQLKLALAQVDMELSQELGTWTVKSQSSTLDSSFGGK